MALIVEQYVGDRAIQLGREQLFRKFSFGTDWQRIRVGIRASMTAVSGTTIPGYFNGPIMGLCTGPLGALNATQVDCIFSNFWGGNSATLAGVSPNLYYDLGSTGWTQVTYQKVNNSQSNSAGFGFGRSCIGANPGALRSFFAYDITKGTVGVGTYTVVFYYQINTQATVDFNRSAFLSSMMTDGTPTNTTATAPGANGYCGLRTTKDWDTMFVANWRSTPTLTIFDMAVVRYS